jgi:hypothetical protein
MNPSVATIALAAATPTPSPLPFDELAFLALSLAASTRSRTGMFAPHFACGEGRASTKLL